MQIGKATVSKYIRALVDAKILYQCSRFDMKSKRSLLYVFPEPGARPRRRGDLQDKIEFFYPLQMTRNGGYKIRSGELIRVCMTSDFFLEEKDLFHLSLMNLPVLIRSRLIILAETPIEIRSPPDA